jgi:O-antigen/teichoic acid export membrane protein
MFKNWLNYSSFGLANSLLTALNSLLLAKIFSVEVFGIIALINAGCMFLTQILPFNALGYVPILYSDADASTHKIKKQNYFSILGFMSFVTLPISIWITAFYFNDWSLGILILLFCCVICLNDFDNSFSIQHSLSKKYGIAISISRMTFLCFILIISFFDSPSIHIYLIMGIGAEILSAIYRRNIYDISSLFEFRYVFLNSSQRNFILKYGIKYFPLTILGWVFMYADRFVISDRLSLVDVAKYAIATTIASAVVLFGNTVVNTLFPGIYRLKLDNLRSYVFYLKMQLYLFLGGLVISLALFYVAPYILYVLGKNEYTSLAELVFILSICFTVQGVSKIPSAFLDANILYLSKTLLFGIVGIGALFINMYFLVELTVDKVAYVFLLANLLILVFTNIRIGYFIFRQD